MLNQHRNLVVPESDWLRVGECLVDVPRREVRCGGESRRITVKALQVLLVLVAHAGKVVSREALLEWVWADTLPTDDVLTQAITQLRKAFADDREAPRYLETIAKGGYRLLAPVEWQMSPEPVVGAPYALPVAGIPTAAAPESAAAPAANTGPAPETPRSAARWVAIAGLAVAVVGAAWLLRGQRDPGTKLPVAPAASLTTAPAASYQRITSAPGGELWPSLSPDGAQVVYSAWSTDGEQAGLMLQTTAPVPPRPLTSPPKGVQDTMPMWSPNGREIVFQRLGPADQCELDLIPASGGEPRTLGACKRSELGSYSWFPDGRRLIGSELGAAKDDDGALHVLDVGTGTWTRLPYRKAPSDIDLGPMVSPDGRWIAFRRNISLSDVWRVPVAGGEPERLTDLRANLFGLAWTPDSRALIVSRYQDAGVQLARIDVDRHAVQDIGIADGYYPAIALRAASLAFVVGQTQSAMFRLDATRADATPQPLFPSTGLNLMPSVSPDGMQVVWMSNRTGRLALWWARPDQPESLRLIDGVVPMPRYPAIWAADGSRLLIVGRDGMRQVLYEVQPGSGRVQRLPVPAGDPVYAEYLPDANRLLVVADRGSGRLGLTLYDRRRTPWAPLAQLEDVAMTRVDLARNRLLFTRPTTPGLWQADFDLRNVRALDSKPEVGGGRRIALLPDGLWFARNDSRCGLQWAPLDAEKVDAPCRHPGSMLAGVTYDAAHRQLFYAVEREQSPDIGWMPLPTH